MTDKKHYGRQVVVSLVVTIAVLAVVVVCFRMFFLPKHPMNNEQIYDVAVKVFPLLIGFVMIQAGMMVAHRRDEDYADDVDKLPPNAYDMPLQKMPGDDPSRLNTQAMASTQAVVVPAQKEEISVSPEAAKVAEEAEKKETIEVNFESIFNEELQSAQDTDYDITLCVASVPETYQEKMYGKMATMVGNNAYAFTLDNGTTALIFPFYNQKETQEVVSNMDETLKGEFKDVPVKYGFSSRNGRVLSTDILKHEADVACGL